MNYGGVSSSHRVTAMHPKVLSRHLSEIASRTLYNRHTDARLYILREVLGEACPSLIEDFLALQDVEILFPGRAEVDALRSDLTEERLRRVAEKELSPEEIEAIWKNLR